MRAAQTDRHDTWIEKKITRRTSLDKFQDANNARIKTHEKLSEQNSNETRNPTTTVPITSSKINPPPTATKPPAPALKPQRSSASTFQPIPPPPPDYKEEFQTTVVVSFYSNIVGRSALNLTPLFRASNPNFTMSLNWIIYKHYNEILNKL